MTKEVSHSEINPMGLLGLGLAGSAIAKRCIAAGLSIAGYDPDEDAARKFVASGGELLADEAAVAGRCRVSILSLPGPAEVRAVLQKISGHLRTGDTIIDTTTGDAASVECAAQRLRKLGVEYLDATIGGSSSQVEQGDAIVICGASDEAFARARALLHRFGRAVFHTGAPGTGTRMKLVLNMVLGLHRAVLAEGLEFARRSGIDPDRALEILKAGPAYSVVMDKKGQKMIQDDFLPEARLAQHWKDVQLMLSSGSTNGAHLPLTTLHEQLLRAACEAGWGAEDNSAVIKLFREKRV